MTAKQLRQKYLEFFKSKGHTIIPSASLLPENDPTTLFTSAGMQPMVPYLLGEKHPVGNRITDSQKCFRTQDIDDVGDNRHTTFFEMLGNWSFGDYFKKEQIEWMFDFLTKEVGLDPKRLYISCFRGAKDIDIPRDEEAAKLWQEKFKDVGIDAKIVDNAETDGMQTGRIFYYDATKNWWSRAGEPEKMPVGEPGGPDSEMFWDFGADLGLHEKWINEVPKSFSHTRSGRENTRCHINCDCGRFVEIGNNVFMQYIKTESGFEELKQKNIDFGGGLERMSAVLLNTSDIFKIDLFAGALKKIEELSGKRYGEDDKETLAFRVILDHLRAATFLIADGAVPSNKDQGYFTRRLIRRSVRFARDLNIHENFCSEVCGFYIDEYMDAYLELAGCKEIIFNEIKQEESKFRSTLEIGLKELRKMIEKKRNGPMAVRVKSDFGSKSTHYVNLISGKEAFDLYQNYGFPPEMIAEELARYGMGYHEGEFEQEMKKHQELSRAGAEQKFKGGLADTSEISTKYHTATHLLLAALNNVLGDGIYQKGSNITSERLRFDFNYPEKLSSEQIQQVEDLVNEKIQADLKVEMIEMPKTEALKSVKVSFDPDKYPDKVKVYQIGRFSIELCGGPHVDSTGLLGKFRILKEEASSAGVRRIKAVLE